jgi:Secretion system C-terminal sorting domain
VDIHKIMRIIIIILLLFFLKISDCYSQCECYSIKKISISQEVKETVAVTFYNECDINVYLQFWLIFEKDTIARFDKCLCGAIPIKRDNEIYYLDTKLTKLPPLNSLRVALSNGTLNCPSIKFSPELLALGIDDLDKNKTLIYPNPTEDTVFLEAIPLNTKVQLLNIQGFLLDEIIFKNKDSFNLKSYPSGTYIIRYQVNSEIITHKIIKK